MRKRLLNSSIDITFISHLEGRTPTVQLPRFHAQLEIRLWILDQTQYKEFPG